MPDLLDSVQVYADSASLDEVYFLRCPQRCGWMAEKTLWGFAIQEMNAKHIPIVRQSAFLLVVNAMQEHLKEAHGLSATGVEPVADSGTME